MSETPKRKQGQRGPDKKKRDKGSGGKRPGGAGAQPGAGRPKKEPTAGIRVYVADKARIAKHEGSQAEVIRRALDALERSAE